MEFEGLRAKLYEKALNNYPLARQQDIDVMYKLLNPQKGEKILGIGEGNGYFCKNIAESIGKQGHYLITDPSLDQLNNLKKKINYHWVKIKKQKAEEINYKNKFDKAWTFGAFHHCKEQEKAIQKIYSALKSKGRLVLCDVFSGSKLAKHFDGPVSNYCITGHDVNFLSDTYAKTIVTKTGFENIKLINLNQKWIFEKEEKIGEFIYNLHAMTLIKKEPYKEVLKSCKEILGIKKTSKGYELNWPMKAIIAEKITNYQ